jgi:CBS domain containing-hemolysin-like protein
MAMMPRYPFRTNGAPTLSPAGGLPRLLLAGILLLWLPSDARASLLSPEAEDKLATFLALFVLFVVPVVLITLFWLVHILPEKIAHQRHHPQFEAIRTLCLLSLVFGGLLWPLAWIWAYTKPVLHKMAYGTDTAHTEDNSAYGPADLEAKAGGERLRDRVARLEGRVPPSELTALRADLDALEARLAENEGR